MFEEEPRLRPQRPLDDMSIEELRDRIAGLKEQIEACEAMIVRKEASRKAADAAFFRSPAPEG